MKTVALRTVALILLVGGVPLILGPPSAQAATSSFTATASGLSATATFVTNANGTVSVTLNNTLAASAFTTSAQAISDISFTTSSTLGGTPTGSGATGQLINISSSGAVTPISGAPTRWTDAGSLSRTGNTVTVTVLGGGQPSEMVAPSGTSFPNINTGVLNFIPYTSGTVSFTVGGLTGVTATTTITAATFSFGTGPETFVPGTPTTTPVPEPSTLAIAGLGTLGFLGYGLRRRLKS